MDKKFLHHLWTRIRPVRTLYLFGVFLLMGTICVLALRDNYSKMVDLRESVYAADKSGVGVEEALQELRAHVNGHMNTSLTSGAESIYPPIHLKETYDRLKKAEQDRVNTVNSKVYTDAQAHCERLYPGSFSGGPRVPCIEQYVKQNGTTVQPIPDALYKFAFASPSWSPDLAGWTFVLTIVMFVLTIVRFLFGRLMKAL